MMFLRFIAFLAGTLALVLPPVVLSDAHTGNLAGGFVAEGLLGMMLLASSFFYIAFVGRRMRRSIPLRILGGVLLMVPVGASLTLLLMRDEEAMLWTSAGLLSLSALLFLYFVFPAVPASQRPMRARERHDPALQAHQR